MNIANASAYPVIVKAAVLAVVWNCSFRKDSATLIIPVSKVDNNIPIPAITVISKSCNRLLIKFPPWV